MRKKCEICGQKMVQEDAGDDDCYKPIWYCENCDIMIRRF